MSGLLEVVNGGLAVSIQDRGRPGHRAIGIPLSGALDPRLMAAANALADNPPDAAVLEIPLTGPGLKAVRGPVRVGLAGALDARRIDGQGRSLAVAPWSSVTLFAGDTLLVGNVRHGIAYLAVSGGFQTEATLGSRATYRRAGLGGVRGALLATGQQLPCGLHGGNPWQEWRNPTPLPWAAGPIRLIPGPQQAHFTPEALAALVAEPFRVSSAADRMGMRLEGPTLGHNALGADILSDGVTPGCIQVPANGQPIILLADCQTTGGYPKIGTVISADLPRLGHARPGDLLRFTWVDMPQALAARRESCRQLDTWLRGLQPYTPPGVIDEAALYSANLAGCAIRGDDPHLSLEPTQ